MKFSWVHIFLGHPGKMHCSHKLATVLLVIAEMFLNVAGGRVGNITLLYSVLVYICSTLPFRWLAKLQKISKYPAWFFSLRPRFFEGVLGTRFGSLELKIVSLESEKVIRFLESEKSDPYRSIHTRYLTFSFKKKTDWDLAICLK